MPEQPDKKTLRQVYLLMPEELNQNKNFVKELDDYRKVDYKTWEDNDFFETISEVIFYSNLPRETVNHKLPAIEKAFTNFTTQVVFTVGIIYIAQSRFAKKQA